MGKQLGQLLIDKNIITQQQLDEALKIQKEKGGLLGQVLIDSKFISEENLVMALADQYGFPYLPLANYEIDTEVTKLVPENVAKQYHLIPIDKIGNILTIVMADPLNDYAIKDIEYITNCKVKTFVSTVTDIKNTINRFYGSSEKTKEDISKFNFSNAPKDIKKEQEEIDRRKAEMNNG